MHQVAALLLHQGLKERREAALAGRNGRGGVADHLLGAELAVDLDPIEGHGPPGKQLLIPDDHARLRGERAHPLPAAQRRAAVLQPARQRGKRPGIAVQACHGKCAAQDDRPGPQEVLRRQKVDQQRRDQRQSQRRGAVDGHHPAHLVLLLKLRSKLPGRAVGQIDAPLPIPAVRLAPDLPGLRPAAHCLEAVVAADAAAHVRPVGQQQRKLRHHKRRNLLARIGDEAGLHADRRQHHQQIGLRRNAGAAKRPDALCQHRQREQRCGRQQARHDKKSDGKGAGKREHEDWEPLRQGKISRHCK